MDSLRTYYDRRAPEYDAVYQRDDPARQQEQAALARALQHAVSGRRVLEVACGTGYWTAYAAQVARHVVATDASEEMLAIARGKPLSPQVVTFQQADAYHLGEVTGSFDSGLAAFWLSHVPQIWLDRFLAGFHRQLLPGSVIFLTDNVHRRGVGGELIAPRGSHDTFKLRTLSDGSRFRILKNYYDADRLHDTLAPYARDLSVHVGEYYCWARYTI